MTVVQLEVPDDAAAAWLRAHAREAADWATRNSRREAAQWPADRRARFRDETRSRLNTARTPEQEEARQQAVHRIQELAAGHPA